MIAFGSFIETCAFFQALDFREIMNNETESFLMTFLSGRIVKINREMDRNDNLSDFSALL